jgi:hypothetical protein
MFLVLAFTADDLENLSDLVATTWRAARGLEWSVPAGTLTWTCTATADHTVDAVLAPATFLASRKQDGYPAFEPFTLGAVPSPDDLADGLETATRVLLAVVAAAAPADRAVIWRRPEPTLAPPADFLPRGGFELLLHAHDIAVGLAVPFDPPLDLCERIREHTATWPYWSSPGWTALTMTGDPWFDLLRGSGRAS